MLIGIEDRVEGVLRRSQELRRRVLLAQRSLKVGVRFPNFAHRGVARSGEFIFGSAQIGFRHFHFMFSLEPVEKWNGCGYEPSPGWLGVSEKFGSADTD